MGNGFTAVSGLATAAEAKLNIGEQERELLGRRPGDGGPGDYDYPV